MMNRVQDFGDFGVDRLQRHECGEPMIVGFPHEIRKVQSRVERSEEAIEKHVAKFCLCLKKTLRGFSEKLTRTNTDSALWKQRSPVRFLQGCPHNDPCAGLEA